MMSSSEISDAGVEGVGVLGGVQEQGGGINCR
jgi:hypothetical protein